MSDELTRRFKRLEAVQEDAKRVVWRLKRELSSCDEDDRDSLEKDLEEAEEWLRKVDYWIGQVADALPPMKRANQNIHALVEKRLPCAARFLTEKLARFAEYARLAIPHEGVASQRMGAAMPSSTLANVAAADLAGQPGRITELPLPSGFQWISLDSISRDDDLRPDETFHKVPKPDVISGFSRLKDEVLTGLRGDLSRGSDYFRELDNGRGLTYENGTQRIYEAFFGQDCIALERGRSDGNYGITNGRHRIHVARELGWVAVPARVL